jgi:glutamate synthase (ferredoxin)
MASDSSNLDMIAELLMRSGRSPEETLMMMVPEAYKKHPTLDVKYPEVVDFYEYYKGQMEAWDGPALLLFSGCMFGSQWPPPSTILENQGWPYLCRV